MNGLNRRQSVLTMVMAAGLAGCAADRAAVACPPEEGATPPPAQQIEREIVVRGVPVQVKKGQRVVAPRIAGVTLTDVDERNVLIAADPVLGSTLETRVYRPGEAMAVHGMKFADEPVRTLRVKEDGRDIRVEQRGQKVTATINGKEVPADAVTVKDGTIEVRGADGKTVLKEEWPEISATTRVVRGQALAVSPVPPVPPVPPGVTWPGNEEETPRVMMGITMDDADEELVEQLGLPEGDYAVIQAVPEGLPAAKAGLQPKDLIVTVDGKSAAGGDAVREVMKTKQPGDTIALEVIRKGNRIKFDVKLEAFDAKRFKAYGQAMSPGQNEDMWKAYGDQMKVWGEKYGKEMEEKARAMGGEFKNHIDIEALKDHLKLAIPRGSNGEPMILMSPAEGGQKLEERLNAMEAQLKRLEDLLKRLESRTATPAPAGSGGGTPTPWVAMSV